MMVPVVTMLAAHLVIAVADRIPTFDIAVTCRAAATSAARDILGNNTESCANDERDARNTLVKEWGQFSAANRRSCTALATSSTESSYVELLTCLEMTRDAKATPATGGTTGKKR